MTSKTIGAYELGEELGKGPLGTLFLGRSDKEGDVLLRIVRARLPLTKAAIERVGEAAQSAIGLTHHRVASVVEVVAGADQVAIVMKAARGQLLSDALKRASVKRKPMPLPIAARIAVDLCEAIAFAHASAPQGSAAFGGVSPDSALVGPDGVTRLLDLLAAPAARNALGTTPRFLAYQSPEHFQELELTATSDVFSLAALVFELAVGRAPFASMSVAEVRKRVLAPVKRADADGLIQRPELTPLADILERALQGDPSERFRSATEMSEAIEAAVKDAASHDEVAEHFSGAPKAPTIPLPRPLIAAAPGTLKSPKGVAGDAAPGKQDTLDDIEMELVDNTSAPLSKPPLSTPPPPARPAPIPKPSLPVAVSAPRNPFLSKPIEAAPEADDDLNWEIDEPTEAKDAAAGDAGRPPGSGETARSGDEAPSEIDAGEPPPAPAAVAAASPAETDKESEDTSMAEAAEPASTEQPTSEAPASEEVSIDVDDEGDTAEKDEPHASTPEETFAPAALALATEEGEPPAEAPITAAPEVVPEAASRAPLVLEAPSAAALSAPRTDEAPEEQAVPKRRRGLFLALGAAAMVAIGAIALSGSESEPAPRAAPVTVEASAEPPAEVAPPTPPKSEPAPTKAVEATVDAGPDAPEPTADVAEPATTTPPAPRPPSAATKPAGKPQSPAKKPPAKKFIPQGI